MEAAAQPTLLLALPMHCWILLKAIRMPLQHTIIMETGGMKGRKKELVRADVHAILKKLLH